jgi:hypothetical protein
MTRTHPKLGMTEPIYCPRYTGNLAVEILIKFLERLIHPHAKKLFWMTGRHPIHLNPRVKKWLEHQTQQI